MSDIQNREDALKNRVSRLRTVMTVWVPFFGHLLLKLDPRIAGPDSPIKTAGVTRDRKLFLNLDFCEKLSDQELAGVLIHEVMHPAFLCWERQGSRHAVAQTAAGDRISVWNVAHDFAINGIIDQMIENIPDIKLPEGACLDRAKYGDWSAEEIYDDLLTQMSKNPKGGSPGNIPKNPWGVDDIMEDGEGGGDEGDEPNGGEGGTNSRTEAQNRELDNYWKVSVLEAAQVHERAKNRGSLPGALQKLIDAIVDPKINWVDALSRWVGENGRRADFSYRRPARRSEAVGEILAS
ncbi:MAG: hypothetical protein EBU84_08280, partial [Actinobacteria bacterium]|nr:hypothetical protein [Actinomycetota bacterium]